MLQYSEILVQIQSAKMLNRSHFLVEVKSTVLMLKVKGSSERRIFELCEIRRETKTDWLLIRMSYSQDKGKHIKYCSMKCHTLNSINKL